MLYIWTILGKLWWYMQGISSQWSGRGGWERIAATKIAFVFSFQFALPSLFCLFSLPSFGLVNYVVVSFEIFEFITIFKVAVLLTMAYVFLRVYSEGSSGRVYQCGIPERPLDCEPLYVSEIPLFLIISNFKYLICVVLGMRFFHWFD